MKKYLILFLSLCLLGAALPGCGKNDNNPVSEPSSEKPEATVFTGLLEGDNPQYINDFFSPETSVPIRNDRNRYSDRISTFAAQGLGKEDIVFYGHSFFTRWSDSYDRTPLEKAVLSESGEQVCVNRGFGGSNIHDLCLQYSRVLQPYQYKAIVITAFMNASGYSNLEQMQLMAWLITQIRTDNPNAHVYVTDRAPTSKAYTSSQVQSYIDLNRMLLTYCANFDNVTVIELSKEPMFYTDSMNAGTYLGINDSLYVEDQVHLNNEGYELFADVFRKALKEELK